MVHFLASTLFPLAMIGVGVGDMLTLKIPNWLNSAIVILFFPMAFLTSMPLAIFWGHLAVGLGLFVLGFCVFAMGFFGGGDAKILAASGLWFGWPFVFNYLILTVFAGGLLALLIGLWSLVGLESEIRDLPLLKRLGGSGPSVPYGYAFAVGALLSFSESWWMRYVFLN